MAYAVSSGEEEHHFHGCMLVFLVDTPAACCQLHWRLQREWISLPKVQVLHGSASRTTKQGAHVHNLSSRKNNDT